MDQFFSNPSMAIGFLFFVVVLILFYIGQRERARVNRLKGRRGFSPRWHSGRRHRKRISRSADGGFKPEWCRTPAGDGGVSTTDDASSTPDDIPEEPPGS